MERFFPDEEEAVGAEHEAAASVLAFAELPYFRVHIAWLERQANRPLPEDDAMKIVKAAVRANTLREVRSHLLREVEQATAAQERLRNG